MKRNLQKTMDNLEIDPRIRKVVRQLWKHNYKTKNSCQGHQPSHHHPNGDTRYIEIFKNTGDGWWEQNATYNGLSGYDENTTDDPNTVCWYSRKL